MHQARTHAFTFTEIPIARFFFQKQQKKTLKRFSFTHLQSLAIVEISMHVTVRLKKKKKCCLRKVPGGGTLHFKYEV